MGGGRPLGLWLAGSPETPVAEMPATHVPTFRHSWPLRSGQWVLGGPQKLGQLWASWGEPPVLVLLWVWELQAASDRAWEPGARRAAWPFRALPAPTLAQHGIAHPSGRPGGGVLAPPEPRGGRLLWSQRLWLRPACLGLSAAAAGLANHFAGPYSCPGRARDPKEDRAGDSHTAHRGHFPVQERLALSPRQMGDGQDPRALDSGWGGPAR